MLWRHALRHSSQALAALGLVLTLVGCGPTDPLAKAEPTLRIDYAMEARRAYLPALDLPAAASQRTYGRVDRRLILS